MDTNILNEFNKPKYNWATSFRRSFTSASRKRVKHSDIEALSTRIDCLSSQVDALSMHRRRANTVSGYRNRASSVLRKPFTNNKEMDFNPSYKNRSSTIRRMRNLLNSESEPLNSLEKAKKFFKEGCYKEAKKAFKKILQSKPSEQEKATSELYLATIYLSQNSESKDKLSKAKEFLKGKVSESFVKTKTTAVPLAQIMYSHIKYLIEEKEHPKKARGLFLAHYLYEKTESFSEDEKVMAGILYKKFCIA
ncbi:hypothetical protein [Candidatus Rhabdochlamydia porcellionis]|jgi:hypothetical protein|uniref:Tetratricopeptide repeat protein n=1 Tax=Candidatus Rhabdochlamydia porcellionis TaxID=225148 RepID=A0ABX8YZI4_9BACT|nr:hypothetical protein [Candidatus Rhabdochlamydia porcellionis]QZA58498.1 hypothetical protein RHAB15C_0000372 [Candidatus Rhabdochlamydia porcellionis]